MILCFFFIKFKYVYINIWLYKNINVRCSGIKGFYMCVREGEREREWERKRERREIDKLVRYCLIFNIII